MGKETAESIITVHHGYTPETLARLLKHPHRSARVSDNDWIKAIVDARRLGYGGC